MLLMLRLHTIVIPYLGFDRESAIHVLKYIFQQQQNAACADSKLFLPVLNCGFVHWLLFNSFSEYEIHYNV